MKFTTFPFRATYYKQQNEGNWLGYDKIEVHGVLIHDKGYIEGIICVADDFPVETITGDEFDCILECYGPKLCNKQKIKANDAKSLTQRKEIEELIGKSKKKVKK
jgi:hypothetical protein